MRKPVLLLFLLAGFAIAAEEPFREWNRSSKVSDPDFKNIGVIDARLVEFEPGFERKNHSEYYRKWLADAGIKDDVVPNVKLKVKIPQGRNEKKEPADEEDYNIPLPVFSQADQDYVLDWDWARNRQPFLDRCMQVVLGEERDIHKQRPRSRDGKEPGFLSDRIYLRNGSKIDGMVKNARFSIHTAYGEFKVDRDRLAAIQLGDSLNGRDVLIGVNNNRFSGFLDLPADVGVTEANYLTFETQNGVQEIRREEVVRIIFQVREGELEGLSGDASVNVWLKNGDYFDATVYEGNLPVGNRPVPVGDVAQVEVGDGQAAVMLKDGGRVNWSFGEEDLPMELDFGPKLRVYHGHLGRIFCDRGYRPVGRVVEVAEERDASLSFQRDAPLGRVRSISSSSVFSGVLEEGDRIVSVNRRKVDFEGRKDSYELALDDMFPKNKKPIPHIELGVQRGEQEFFQVTIVRAGGTGG